MKKPNILYIIPIRNKNSYRSRNFNIVLQWINDVRETMKKNFDVIIDISVIEQDNTSKINTPQNVQHVDFICNLGTFNKGWSFNVVVKKYPTYDYYIFADADIIIPNIEALCESMVDHMIINPVDVFRPFTNRLDTTLTDSQMLNSWIDIHNNYQQFTNKLCKHGGLSFASNMIIISKKLFDMIGGWEETFRGWGRYDDFVTHKLSFIGQCNTLLVPLDAIHLFHPISMDYSLNNENIRLYDMYIKYSKNELLQLIDSNNKIMGNPDKYK